jgi:hypothetical protein
LVSPWPSSLIPSTLASRHAIVIIHIYNVAPCVICWIDSWVFGLCM